MELFEYLHRYGMRSKDLAEKIDCTSATIFNLKQRRTSSSLITAAKLHYLTKGKVTFFDLLSKEDVEDLQNWLQMNEFAL